MKCTNSYSKNNIIFLLPKPLIINDKIKINGQIIPSTESLFLNITTGTRDKPNYENIACQLEVSFHLQKITLRVIENGNRKKEQILVQSPSDLFKDSIFNFTVIVRTDESLNLYIGESHAGFWELEQKLQTLTLLTISEDVGKVEELNFKYA